MKFNRTLNIDNIKGSAFIFGPRMTGKTFLLQQLEAARFFDLIVPETELELKQFPVRFWEALMSLPAGALVIIDEVQRVPALLNYVQKAIEEKQLRFILSGSSARKLKRGAANFLGGRAKDLRLHPLTHQEMKDLFRLEGALAYGTMPKIADLVCQGQEEEARDFLRAYITTYIKEEIQAEALTRNVGAFQRFLTVAGQVNGQVIEFSNIARECSVPASTVKEYFSILEDTLLARFLWPWDRSERKKARPKFYFFDCGVVRALQGRLSDPPTPMERGFLFEQWFFNELVRLNDYYRKDHEFVFWRHLNHEVDILVFKAGKPLWAFECRTSADLPGAAAVGAFKKRFPDVMLWVVTPKLELPRQRGDQYTIVSWQTALEKYLELK